MPVEIPCLHTQNGEDERRPRQREGDGVPGEDEHECRHEHERPQHVAAHAKPSGDEASDSASSKAPRSLAISLINSATPWSASKAKQTRIAVFRG